jgi:hypothetical protein
MKSKMVVVFLVAAVLFGAIGCGKKEPAPKKQTVAPQKGQPGTARSEPPTTVGGQQPAAGTAQQPAAKPTPGRAGESNQPASARAPSEQGGVTTISADVSTQAYVQQSEQTITTLQQKMSDLQGQIGLLKPEAQQKAQQLQERFQKDLTNARAALDKVKTASGENLKNSRAAADNALSDAAAALKEIQSYITAQTQATK